MPIVRFALRHASLFTTNENTRMSAATNASRVVADLNDVASLALNNVSS